MKLHSYWGYGLFIASEIEFPELLPFDFESPDLTVRIGKTPESITSNDVVKRVNVSISTNEYLLDFKNHAKYYAANGNQIIIEPETGADEKTIRLFALSNAFAAILYQRNQIPLHASAILHEGELVLFCGNSGAGKSTLLTALSQKNMTVFSDDVCVLSKSESGRVTAQPSYPMIKLWKDSFIKTGLEAQEETTRIRPELPKYAKFFHDSFQTQGFPIKKVFILDNDSKSDEVELKKLSPLESFTHIQKNSYRPLQLNSSKRRDTLFALTVSLTQSAEVYKSARPISKNTVAQLTQLILESL